MPVNKSAFATAVLCAVLPWDIARGAGIEIDNTCASCSRRENDSLNVFHRRPIRVNQAGYTPGGIRKIAFAAASDGGEFHVIDEKGAKAHTGMLTYTGSYSRPRFIAPGYSNYITREYLFESDSGTSEPLYMADFSGFRQEGRYRLARGGDTSAPFLIHPLVYDKVLEKVLFFFGAQRCGRTDSWMHAACHLKDGAHLGADYAGKLAGGWHDCGGHAKPNITIAYSAMVLSLAYAIWPERAPDLYGASYADAEADGIPDLLGEAKIGSDYIYNLYLASKELGLLDSSDMFHSVGQDGGDAAAYWGIPEKEDEAPHSTLASYRFVTRNIGSNVAGSFAATLAFSSVAWATRNPEYAAKLKAAAIDIYDNIVMKKLGTASAMPCCYPGSDPGADDEAMAALALWFATKDARFGFDLLENPAINKKAVPVQAGDFPGGHMGTLRPFHHGGWTTEYGNIHAYVLYGLAKLILPDAATASSYGIPAPARDSLWEDAREALRKSISEGSNGSNAVKFPGIKVDEPYHGVFTSVNWGFNRYNLGMASEILMYYDLTGSKPYGEVGTDNFNYLLGANPYDISFITGCGDRNLQHPHNRAANPEGINPGQTPYPIRAITGAVMGGVNPGAMLKDNMMDYTSTETCIDFASQVVIPLLILGRENGNPTAIGKRKGIRPRLGIADKPVRVFNLLGRKLPARP